MTSPPEANPAGRLRDLYHAEQLPVLQNRMHTSVELAKTCSKGDMILAQDEQTGLIFNRAFDPELVVYDAEYQNEQALSSAFREHLDTVAEVIGRHLEGQTLISVGCGKGYFLEQLQGLGFAITGYDPSYQGDNPAISKELFTPALKLHADGLVLRHVLEHIVDPVSFLGQMARSNGGSGKIYIEVPCFDWICANHAWFDIFYEHVNYFRLSDFERIFGKLYESGRSFGGQYLYVVAELSSLRQPEHVGQPAFAFPAEFLGMIERYADKIKDQKGKRRSVVWGGASKGLIFSLLLQRAGAEVDFVVDINPAKQNMYLGASGLPVHSPEAMLAALDGPADIYVMNRIYLNEIKALMGAGFDYFTVDSAQL